MGKLYDLDKQRQKAKDRVKDFPPPVICVRSKYRKVVVYPKWEKRPDGKWRIMHLEVLKAMLGYGRDEIDKKEEPEGS
jgi:hypothetical protein